MNAVDQQGFQRCGDGGLLKRLSQGRQSGMNLCTHLPQIHLLGHSEFFSELSELTTHQLHDIAPAHELVLIDASAALCGSGNGVDLFFSFNVGLVIHGRLCFFSAVTEHLFLKGLHIIRCKDWPRTHLVLFRRFDRRDVAVFGDVCFEVGVLI